MAELAQPFEERRSRWRLAWEALRGSSRAVEAATATEKLDTSVSFPELVWAHFERQKEVKTGVLNGPWEEEYRRRLARFKAEHGQVREAYWCRYEASGVALTERRLPRSLSNLRGRETAMQLHAAVDWRTANAPKIAAFLHQWETAAIKASEVLRSSTERIALAWIFSATTRLLSLLDRKPGTTVEDSMRDVAREHERELAEVQDYYARAGENSARLVYFRGMLWGTALLVALVGGGFLVAWALDWLQPGDTSTYTLFVVLAMGAAGAFLSVLTRMARRNGFAVDFEVGRKSVRYLGGIRPWIGALLALALYLALKSSLIELLQGTAKGIYFYASVAFLSGFSERRAKVMLGGILAGGTSGSGGSTSEPAKAEEE
jgi:hypothetical protein